MKNVVTQNKYESSKIYNIKPGISDEQFGFVEENDTNSTMYIRMTLYERAIKAKTDLFVFH